MTRINTTRPTPDAPPANFDDVLARAAAKDRANMQRHLDELGPIAPPEHLKNWQKLVLMLSQLAPHAIDTVGRDAIRFYIADGRYRLQRFALEDQRQGQIHIFLLDVLDQAIKKKVLASNKVPGEYVVPGDKSGEPLHIERLDSDNTAEPAAHFKFMIGMGRKALRVTIPATARSAQLKAIEGLCELAATVKA